MKNDVIKLNLEGKSNCEIRKITGYSLNTITKYLKQEGLDTNRNTIEKLLPNVEILFNEGKTTKQIAIELLASHTTILKCIQQFLHKEPNSIKMKSIVNLKLELTLIQKEVLYGSLLGDMSISKHSNFARFSISQGGKQEEYFDKKCEIFKNLLGKVCKKARFDKRTNKFYNKYTVRSLSNLLFLTIYNELYIENKKIITLDYLNHITPLGLAYWYMDDGDKTGVLATNCFTVEECNLIRSWLKNKYNIETTLRISNNLPIIYFTKKGKVEFYKLTHKFFIPSMLYKIENWIP